MVVSCFCFLGADDHANHQQGLPQGSGSLLDTNASVSAHADLLTSHPHITVSPVNVLHRSEKTRRMPRTWSSEVRALCGCDLPWEPALNLSVLLCNLALIAADTVVVKDEEIMEKPQDSTDNLRMLAELNDNQCEVISGVTIVYPILEAPGFKVR